MIAVVKLKTAKEYLKTLFYVTGDAPVYQMTDIMAGIRYLLRLSEELVKPLVICLGLGTSQGDHSGDSPWIPCSLLRISSGLYRSGCCWK